MSNSVFVMAFSSSVAGVTFSVTEMLAPSLVAKLYRSRELLRGDDEIAFSDATLRRVMNLLARNKQVSLEVDAAAGSDGSIGVLFERGITRLYADFLNNGRVRVFVRSADGAESKFITDDDSRVANSLIALAPIQGPIVFGTGSTVVHLNFGADTRRYAEVSYSLASFQP
jgi:hypothetical protein